MSGPAGSPRLTSIHIYPFKAGRAVDLAESVVEPWGLAGDRRWLVVDRDGRFVSQREEPALARVIAGYPAAGTDQATRARGWPARSPFRRTDTRRWRFARRPPATRPGWFPSRSGGRKSARPQREKKPTNGYPISWAAPSVSSNWTIRPAGRWTRITAPPMTG